MSTHTSTPQRVVLPSSVVPNLPHSAWAHLGGLLLNSHSQLLDFLLDSSFHFTLLQGVLHKESFQDERHEDTEMSRIEAAFPHWH